VDGQRPLRLAKEGRAASLNFRKPAEPANDGPPDVVDKRALEQARDSIAAREAPPRAESDED